MIMGKLSHFGAVAAPVAVGRSKIARDPFRLIPAAAAVVSCLTFKLVDVKVAK